MFWLRNKKNKFQSRTHIWGPATLIGKRELVAFTVLLMSCDCYCSVGLPHGAVDRSSMCGNVVFPDYTHLLFCPISDQMMARMTASCPFALVDTTTTYVFA